MARKLTEVKQDKNEPVNEYKVYRAQSPEAVFLDVAGGPIFICFRGMP